MSTDETAQLTAATAFATFNYDIINCMVVSDVNRMNKSIIMLKETVTGVK